MNRIKHKKPQIFINPHGEVIINITIAVCSICCQLYFILCISQQVNDSHNGHTAPNGCGRGKLINSMYLLPAHLNCYSRHITWQRAVAGRG